MAVVCPNSYAALVLIGPTVNSAEQTLPQQAFRLVQDMAGEPASLRRLVAHDVRRMGFGRYLRTVRYMLAHRIEQDVSKCRVSCVLVRGERDPIVPAPWVDWLAKIIPDGVAVHIPSASHNVHYTHASEVARICRSIIGRAL